MKINKIGAVMALALALVSCKNESAKEPVQQDMKFPVELSFDATKNGALRAEEKSSSLSASNLNEREIENLTVVVFTNRDMNNTPVAVEKVITIDKTQLPNDPYQGKIKFDMGMAGTYQLEVIANGYKDASDKEAFLAEFRQGLSYDAFKKVLFGRALPEHGNPGFAMLSAEPVLVKTQAGITASAGTIQLRRLACRFDVFNKLVDELKLTKVTLKNQIVKSYLMPLSVLPDNADGGVPVYTENSTWFTPTLVSGGIYSYENPVKGATTLLVEGTYNGEAWEKTIELKKADGTPIATQRNHIYRIILTKGNGTTPGGGNDPANADKINYIIEVLDWDEDASMDYSDNNVLDTELINNPLSYVAMYNLDKTGSEFVTDMYASNVSGYFDFDTAVEKFTDITIGGRAYHLPSTEEWRSILPFYLTTHVFFNNEMDNPDLSENVMVAGKQLECQQDFKGFGKGVCYALRFKGTEYQSAWKYEYTQVNENNVLRITSRNVADGVTIADVANEAFWQQNTVCDVVRIFPASGFFSHEEYNKVGKEEYFWSSSPNGDAEGYIMYFTSYLAVSYDDLTRENALSIRLFKNRLIGLK